jgi:hypothetical protein
MLSKLLEQLALFETFFDGVNVVAKQDVAVVRVRWVLS